MGTFVSGRAPGLHAAMAVAAGAFVAGATVTAATMGRQRKVRARTGMAEPCPGAG